MIEFIKVHFRISDMIKYCCENLSELRSLLGQLKAREYQYASDMLGASIGQHTRHVLEFYLCLIASQQHDAVNYDQRKRDYLIENSVEEACATIDVIQKQITNLKKDEPLFLEGDFSETGGTVVSSRINTSMYRELAYCLEHTIHHQALIKVVIKELQLTHLLPDNFGIAPATVRHLNKKTHQY